MSLRLRYFGSRTAPLVALAALSLACASHPGAARQVSWRPLAEVLPVGDAPISPGGAVATAASSPTAPPASAADSASDVAMDGPAGVIATESERHLWTRLDGAAARGRFADIFWGRRDLDDDSSVNEARQEFGRRLYVAEAVFGNREQDGWRTPFGRALLVFGFPRRVEAALGGSETVEARAGELPVPRQPISGDWIRWLYGLDLQIGSFTAAAAGGAQRVVYVDYLYSGGAWRMSCGSTLWLDSLRGRGVVPAGSGRVVGRDYRANGGPGQWETSRTAPEVPGTGIPVRGPLLVHGGALAAALPMISPRCLEMIRFRIQRDLRADLLYPDVW